MENRVRHRSLFFKVIKVPLDNQTGAKPKPNPRLVVLGELSLYFQDSKQQVRLDRAIGTLVTRKLSLTMLRSDQ